MRYIIGFISGILGALAGWFGLAMLVIALAGEDRDGGIAMGAFFQIGPVGGVIGFILGVLVFIKLGQKRVTTPDGKQRRRAAPLFAIVVVTVAVLLAYWGWYEFIRSPYLTNGYMTLTMQFKLPPDATAPANSDDVHINIYEGSGQTDVIFLPNWLRKEGDASIITATATLSMKTSSRVVSLEMPGVAPEQWILELPYDPDPTPASRWQLPNGNPARPIALSYQLGTDH